MGDGWLLPLFPRDEPWAPGLAGLFLINFENQSGAFHKHICSIIVHQPQ